MDIAAKHLPKDRKIMAVNAENPAAHGGAGGERTGRGGVGIITLLNN